MTRLAGSRIVFVLESLEMGGAERQALLLARMLRERSAATVHILGLRGGPIQRLCEAEGLSCSSLPQSGSSIFARAVMMLKSLRTHRPDILLPYTSFPNIVAGILWRIAGARGSIWSQRDPGVLRPKGRVGAIAERIAVACTPVFVSNSNHGARFLMDEFGVPQNRIHIVPNALMPLRAPQDRLQQRADMNIDSDAFVAVMTAHFEPEKKDHLTLLDAWKLALPELRRIRGAAHLLLAGRHDRGYAAARERARENEVTDSVHFLGEVNDVGSLLAASDVGVLSSKREGLPNAVLEYIGAGLPIVATRIPGITEIVTDEGDAWLVEPENAQSLANAIVGVATQKAKAQSRADALREKTMRDFGPDRLYAQSVSIIEQVLGS